MSGLKTVAVVLGCVVAYVVVIGLLDTFNLYNLVAFIVAMIPL